MPKRKKLTDDVMIGRPGAGKTSGADHIFSARQRRRFPAGAFPMMPDGTPGGTIANEQEHAEQTWEGEGGALLKD